MKVEEAGKELGILSTAERKCIAVAEQRCSG
jgi:hypothetical protein